VRVLLAGRGSIAQRHARMLREIAPAAQLVVVSSTGTVSDAFDPCEVVPDFRAGLAAGPDAAVIASVSARHASELEAALGQGLPLLVEKPLVTSAAQLARVTEAIARAPRQVQSACVVGCNLRYLPAAGQVRSMLQQGAVGRLVRAHLEVGQDLRQWRPGRDVAASYSADAAQGGGVVFDLVHEIDMAQWLLGPLQVRGALSGRLGGVVANADDVHVGLLATQDGAPVTVGLDYVSVRPVRRYVFVGTEATLVCDVMARSLRLETASGTRDCAPEASDAFDVGATYRRQMQDWLQAIADPAHTVRSPLADAVATSSLMLRMLESGQP
jgi:predicted dehydrogenase